MPIVAPGNSVERAPTTAPRPLTFARFRRHIERRLDRIPALRRRLVEENTSYQQLLDRTRQDLAQQYLQHTTLTPKEIGYLLGYSSVSNFRRAFKSWTGKTLSDARDDGGPVAAEPAAEAAARAPARTEVT